MIFYHIPIKNIWEGPRCFKNKKFTHLMADTKEELINFAVVDLGLKINWLQHENMPSLTHFDVTGIFLQKLLKNKKAIQLNGPEWTKKLKERKLAESE